MIVLRKFTWSKLTKPSSVNLQHPVTSSVLKPSTDDQSVSSTSIHSFTKTTTLV